MATVLTESTASAKSVTESAPDTIAGADYRPGVLEAAEELAVRANSAEEKLAAGKGDTLTLNELSSLTAILYS